MKNKLKRIFPFISLALFGLFIFSLGSDVWEGYAFIFALSVLANLLIRRS
jgi:hypothetical protein